MAYDLCANLDQFLLQRRQRPVPHRSWQHSPPQKVAQIVSQHKYLTASDVGSTSGKFGVLPSQGSLGLQAADICVNAFRRALLGKLLWPSWVGLGRLMLAVESPAVNFHCITEKHLDELPSLPREYAKVCCVLNCEAQART